MAGLNPFLTGFTVNEKIWIANCHAVFYEVAELQTSSVTELLHYYRKN